MNSIVKCPVRDKILVEKCNNPDIECPVRDKIKYCVPDGTLESSDIPDFYQYQIPNGITKQYLTTNKLSNFLTQRRKVEKKKIFATLRLCVHNILFILLLASCVSNENSLNQPSKGNRYASGFEIENNPNGFEIKILSPWMGSSKKQFRYSLKRNINEPAINTVEHQTIQVPVKKVAVMSTSHLAMIESLGFIASVAGFSEKQYVNSSKFWEHNDTSDVVQIGYEHALDIENLIKLKPDVVFMYGLSSAVMPSTELLIKKGIPIVFVSDFNELYPLAKLEWIRFVSCFYDYLQTADSIVNYKIDKYLEVKKKVENVKSYPTVLTGFPWRNVWNIPGSNTTTATFIKDAGGKYVFEHLNQKINYTLSIEEVFMQASQSDFWINTSIAEDISYILSVDSRFSNFKAAQTKNIYNNNKKRNRAGGNDFMESGIMNPEIILADLISILHPELMEGYVAGYYYRLE